MAKNKSKKKKKPKAFPAPICHYCGKDCRRTNEGGLVTFAGTEQSRAFAQKTPPKGFVGYPPNVAWFCDAQYEGAQSASKYTLYQFMMMSR